MTIPEAPPKRTFENRLDKRIGKLREKGVADSWLKIIKSSAMIMASGTIPGEAVLAELDEQISKIRDRSS